MEKALHQRNALKIPAECLEPRTCNAVWQIPKQNHTVCFPHGGNKSVATIFVDARAVIYSVTQEMIFGEVSPLQSGGRCVRARGQVNTRSFQEDSVAAKHSDQSSGSSSASRRPLDVERTRLWTDFKVREDCDVPDIEVLWKQMRLLYAPSLPEMGQTRREPCSRNVARRVLFGRWHNVKMLTTYGESCRPS